jgi:hypothetical protein
VDETIFIGPNAPVLQGERSEGFESDLQVGHKTGASTPLDAEGSVVQQVVVKLRVHVLTSVEGNNPGVSMPNLTARRI